MPRRPTRGAVVVLALGGLLGVAVGIAGYTFAYAKGASYMTNDPAACANCHVMQEYYDGWRKSSHHAVAVCNDCHTPDDPIGKYTTKASNGWHHSYAFTSGDFAEPLRIRQVNRDIVEAQCRRCHGEMSDAVDGHAEELACVRCHASVGHMR